MTFLYKNCFLQKLSIILLTFLLISCSFNQNVSVQSNIALNGEKVFTVDNFLQIQSHGIDCSPDLPYIDGQWQGGTQRAVVLAPHPPPKYQQLEVNEIKTYLNNIAKLLQERTYTADPFAVPQTLQFVSMAMSSTLGKSSPLNEGHSSYAPGCGGILEITNIGNTTFNITQIDLRLTALVTPDLNYYRLLNICPLIIPNQPAICPPGGHGGRGALTSYHFHLDMGKVGTLFRGKPNETSELSIKPGEVAELDIVSDSPTNRVYSLTPEITIDTSGAQQTFQLSQLATTFAFADSNRVSCYELESDNTIRQMDIRIDIATEARPIGNWCI